MYCIGVVLMMGADGQKYFTLRERKGLMDDGYMKWSRNPNYVGEMMIYSSFALLTQRIEPWYVLGYMWTLIFLSRMLQKDYSLSKKAGWKEYASTSWMLPFKFGGSTMMSIIIYGIFFYVVGFCLSNGGMEASVKLMRS
jgi:steroid 5-alpha reductase family enzyme